MTTTSVSIHYPSGDVETVTARATNVADEMELRAHSFLLPLGPGDVVRVDEERAVVDVVSLDPQWIYHVDLHLPADFTAGPMPENHPAMKVWNQLVEEWSRDSSVTVLTTFTLVVSSRSERWLKDKVQSNKYVEGFEITRTPETRDIPTPKGHS